MNGRGNGNTDEVVSFKERETSLLVSSIFLPQVSDHASWDNVNWREGRGWQTNGHHYRINQRYDHWFMITPQPFPTADTFWQLNAMNAAASLPSLFCWLVQVFVRNDLLWRWSSSEGALHLVPRLSHHQLSACQHGSRQVNGIKPLVKKHRKNCKCCQMSLLIVKKQRLSWIQVLNCQNSNQCLNCQKSQ